MLVQNSVYRNTYLTDGVNKEFYFSFPILEASQVLVQTSLLTDTETVTTVDPSQYTVTGVGLTTGGHISFNTAPPTGSRIALTLNIPITQLYQYAELDSFPAKSHEDALAKLTLICQQLKEQISRAVTLPPTSSESSEDVVRAIYASRDVAAASASAASAQATAASAKADEATASATAAAASAAAAAAAVPDNLVERVTAVEGVAASATETPGAGKIPKAGSNGKIDPRWHGTPSRLFASFNTSEPDGLLCNGGAYSRTTYADLFAVIGTSFGAGDGSTTFNVPEFRGRTIQGANANLKAVLQAGLPEIQGGITTSAQIFEVAGPFTTYGGYGTWGNQSASVNSVYFRAGLANPIYGASATVQPPAIAANIFIKY